MNTDNQNGRYVYCIIRAQEEQESFGNIGFQGNEVYTVKYKEFSPVVSDVPFKKYDLDNEEDIKIHTYVVNEVMKKYSVIPVAYGMVFKNKKLVDISMRSGYKAMKKAIEICKRISDNKDVAKVWIRSFTDRDVLLYAQRDSRGIKYFHHIKTTEPLKTEISFLANPYDLEELLKGKQKEKLWIIENINGRGILKDDNGNKLEIDFFKGKFPLEKLPYTPMKDAKQFIHLLEEIIKATSKEVNVIEIGGYEVTIKADIYLKRFNFIEDFQKFIFPLDYIEQLKKNIIWPKSNNNKMSHCSKGNELYIRVESENTKKPEESFRQLFVLTQRETYSPVAKQLEEEVVHTFTVNAEDLWELLNEYPPKISDVYLYDYKGDLMIDPYDKAGEPLEEGEDQPIFQIEYNGQVKRTKIDKNGLMALLSGYKGQQNIDILRYLGDNEDFFALRIYDKNLYSIVVAKKEPNYAKIQAKLDKQLAYEKTLTFLDE